MEKKEIKKTKKVVNPFWYVSKNAMRIYSNVPDARKNTQTKHDSIQVSVSLSKYYPDAARYWQELLDQTKPLLDSKRFENECLSWDLNPENVAQHLVVEGSTVVKKVLKLGLVAGYGEKAKFFVDPLYTLEIKPMSEIKRDANE